VKRILVTGSRDWTDRDAILNALVQAATELGNEWDITLVHGAARGVDRIAAELWGGYLGRFNHIEPHPALWNTYGKGAGFIRNEEMVHLGADLCLAFLMPCTKSEHAEWEPHPSHGGDHTATLAEQAGIVTRRITPPCPE
jgi:hypothetical protein